MKLKFGIKVLFLILVILIPIVVLGSLSSKGIISEWIFLIVSVSEVLSLLVLLFFVEREDKSE